jgi:hypothetical protein
MKKEHLVRIVRGVFLSISEKILSLPYANQRGTYP